MFPFQVLNGEVWLTNSVASKSIVIAKLPPIIFKIYLIYLNNRWVIQMERNIKAILGYILTYQIR